MEDRPKTTVQGAATRLSEQDFTARVKEIMQEVQALAVDDIVALRQTGKKNTPYEAIPKKQVEAKDIPAEGVVVIPAGRWLAYQLTHDPALMATLKSHRGDEKKWQRGDEKKRKQVPPVVTTKCEAFYQRESGQAPTYQKLPDNVRTIIAERFSQMAGGLEKQAIQQAIQDAIQPQNLRKFKASYFLTPEQVVAKEQEKRAAVAAARKDFGELFSTLRAAFAAVEGAEMNFTFEALPRGESPASMLRKVQKGEAVPPRVLEAIMEQVSSACGAVRDVGYINALIKKQLPKTPTLEALVVQMRAAAETILSSQPVVEKPKPSAPFRGKTGSRRLDPEVLALLKNMKKPNGR